MYQVLDEEEEEEEEEDIENESEPNDQDPLPNQGGNIVVDMNFQCFKGYEGSTILGQPPGNIPYGKMKFCSETKERDCSFAIYADDSTNQNRIRMMQSINHPNLLSGMVFSRFEQKIPGSSRTKIYNHLCLDPISGTFEGFVKDNFRVFFSNKTHVLSDRIQNFLRGLINAVAFIHHKGFFHGDVNVKNILYHCIENDYVFFLGNYAGSDKQVEKGQVTDWHCLGRVIESIQTSYVAKRGEENGSKNLGGDLYQDVISVALGELIGILKHTRKDALISIKDASLNSAPFKSHHDRKKYMTVIVPHLIQANEKYCEKLDMKWKMRFQQVPWTSTFGLYLKEMDNYRKNNHGNVILYDGSSGSGFIKYVSGVYTHSSELTNLQVNATKLTSVDLYFITRFVTLFTDLRTIEEELLKEH